jgi:transposase
MRKAKEILRLKWSRRRSHRDVVRAVGVSMGTVDHVLKRAARAGLDGWTAVKDLSEEEVEKLLYGRLRTDPAPTEDRPLPDFADLHAERLKPGVTLALLHVEYREQHPDGYGYTQFCEHYRRWAGMQKRTMRQQHRAGDKLFVDYSGKRPHLVDPETGELVAVELFVAVMGASNYTYAEVTATQRVPDFVASHVRAFEFFEGVTAALVPDQLKSGVTVASWYEPGIQRTYEDLAEHYGTTVIPARPKRPRDKAIVEVGVQVAQRWILARLRKHTFFSLAEMNARIAELRDELNARKMRRYGVSRRELFDRVDRPALLPLPADRYVTAIWSTAKVESDYHVEVDFHAYSVPHRHVGARVEARATATTVEILRNGERIAAHVRSYERGKHTTLAEHLPVAHRKHLEWTPERIGAWAAEVGSSTAALTTAILNERPHPEQGYRSCLGILRLCKRYGAERLERACARALVGGARSYRHVESILRAGLDRLDHPGVPTEPAPTPIAHENVRGGAYYN